MPRIRPCLAGSLVVAAICSGIGTQVAAAQQPAPLPVAAPTRRPLTIDDYAKWRTIDGAQLSGDGKWVAYGLRLTNVSATDTKPVLRIRNLDNNQDIAITDGSNPSFSPDSHWVLYQVDPPAPRNGRGGRGGNGGSGGNGSAPGSEVTPPANPAVPAPPPDTAAIRRAADSAAAVRRRFELRDLSTGRVQAWQDVQSGIFSPTGSHLLLRRRPLAPAGADGASGAALPGGGGRGGGTGAPDGKGNDALLHDLTTGHSLFLGSVEDAVFNRTGDLLAYTVGAAIRDGNGLFAIDLKTGTTHVLDNDAMIYSHPTFTDDGNGIAVLKAKDMPKLREHVVLLEAIPDIRAAFSSSPEPASPVLLEPAKAAGFPSGFVLSDRAPLAWSDDNRRVFVSMMPQSAAADTSRKKNADSVADVDVWRAQDERVQSYQMARADADRNYGFREAFDVTTGKFIRLADSTLRELEVAPDGRWAVGRDIRGYISDYEPARADIYRVNTITGERTVMLKSELVGPDVFGISPDSKHYLYWKDNKFQDYLLDAGTTRTVAAASTPSFVDTEFDHPGPRPPFGVAGYAKDGSGVIVERRYDLWLLPYDGSAPRDLTGGFGSKQEIKLLPVRVAPIDALLPRAERDGRTFDLPAH